MDKKLATLISLFVLAFVLFVSVLAFNQPLKKFTRAGEAFAPSPQSSLVFVWPHSAKADGKSVIKIEVFVRTSSGTPLADKTVAVSSNLGIVSPLTQQSDKAGKASFTLTSTAAGTAQISVTINESIIVDKKPSVQFE